MLRAAPAQRLPRRPAASLRRRGTRSPVGINAPCPFRVRQVVVRAGNSFHDARVRPPTRHPQRLSAPILSPSAAADAAADAPAHPPVRLSTSPPPSLPPDRISAQSSS